jgi:hypothetical protein
MITSGLDIVRAYSYKKKYYLYNIVLIVGMTCYRLFNKLLHETVDSKA